MDSREFRHSPVGQLVPTIGTAQAFVPAPLPRALELSAGTTLLLDEASRAVAYLAGVGETLVNPMLLIRPFLRREAVLSSRIEGTQASLSDLYEFEAGAVKSAAGDTGEVSNYVLAVEHGQERLAELPICGRLVNELHAILLKGVRREDQSLGQWRNEQVWIAAEGTPVEQARFVPPPHSAVPDLMADWEQFVNDAERMPPLIACALMHYQFETIHPYRDGNGRIGRALITLFLIQRRILPIPLLYLSAYFESHRAAYYDHLLGVSRNGDWGPWLKYFLSGVLEQARDATVRSRRIRDLRDEYQQRVQATRASTNAVRLVDELFAHPYLNAEFAGNVLGLTKQGARNILERLVALEIVEVYRDTWPYLYVARELVRTVEEPIDVGSEA